MRRQEILSGFPREELIITLKKQVGNIINFHTAGADFNTWNREEIFENLKAFFPVSDGEKEFLATTNDKEEIMTHYENMMEDLYKQKEKEIGFELMRQIEKMIMLNILDNLWMNHLEDMEYLRDSVRLRAYGQRDPLVEYKHESRKLFGDMLLNFESQVAAVIFKVAPPQAQNISIQSAQTPLPANPGKEIGRNDPCPCGSGKKYKFCHLTK